MAKETKEQKMKFFYLDDEENLKKNKAIVKKKIKKARKQEKKENTEKQENDKFSFDNEIVIGVKRKEEPKQYIKKEKTKKQNNKSTKKQANNKQKQQINKKANIKKTKNNSKDQKQINNKELEKQEIKIKKKRKIACFIKYGMLVILFIIVILCAMFSPLFNIKAIEVEGNEIITQNEIISLSQIKLEENTFKLSKRKIKKQIKENAYIDDVKIIRKLPSAIVIQIQERKPTYLLEYAGSYVYLDKQGNMLEISEKKLELPILQGAVTQTADFIVGSRLCIEDLEKLSIVLKIMELAQNNEIASLITRIDIENEENLKLIFETKEKTAYLGDTSNINTKILTIKSILEKEEGKAGEIFVNLDLNKEYPVFRERV